MNPGKNMTAISLPPVYQETPDCGGIILRDGSTAYITPAKRADADDLKDFFKRLSPQSLQRRFFSASKPDREFIEDLCASDEPKDQKTLIVRRDDGDESQIIATASYFVESEKAAEFAVAVDDRYQHRWLGSSLFERLACVAASNGITHFRATTMAENRPMLEVFRASGFEIAEQIEDGSVLVDITLIPNTSSERASELRDQLLTAASLRPFFQPHSVAVIGASPREKSIGLSVMESLVSAGFAGTIHPVNKRAPVITLRDGSKFPSVPSLSDISGPIDLAIVVVPNTAVLDIVDECAGKGIQSLVIISAGFAETGEIGRALQDHLVEKARGHGMRLIGPNCLGIMNTKEEIQLNASFSPIFPSAGSIAMYSQSGAIGLAVLGIAAQMRLGFSSFVSVGNKADVSGNDLIQYWEQDPETDVILVYLEAFKNPRRFMRIARRVSRTKPIVCLKAGRSNAGQRAAGSHTAAIAGNNAAVDAMFHQSGVIPVNTIEEMFGLATALSKQPLPTGRNVGVVTNAGGPGILCADSCESAGLSLPAFSETLQGKLREILPASASTANPVDMIASASPLQFKDTLYQMLVSPEIDSVIALYISVGVAPDPEVHRAIVDAVAEARAAGIKDKPVLVSLLSHDAVLTRLQTADEIIPVYNFPEAAARVLAAMVNYAEWKNRKRGNIWFYEDAHPNFARAVCSSATHARGTCWLTESESRTVLRGAGLPVCEGGLAKTAEQAVELAEKVGYPVAVKLSSQELTHKTEIGGVHLNLRNADDVQRAFFAIGKSLLKDEKTDLMDGVLVQPMVEGGIELLVGATVDPVYGPLLAFGLGGVQVEVLKDVVFRMTPLTDRDASEMVREIRGHRLLDGFRGKPPADIHAIEEVIMRVSLLLEEVPEIEEIDLNPVIVLPPGEGCRIVDARIRVVPEQQVIPVRYPLPSRMKELASSLTQE